MTKMQETLSAADQALKTINETIAELTTYRNSATKRIAIIVPDEKSSATGLLYDEISEMMNMPAISAKITQAKKSVGGRTAPAVIRYLSTRSSA